MVNENKKEVQLVISHLEGCCGNFLGRLFYGKRLQQQLSFRVDLDDDVDTLNLDGRDDKWFSEIDKRLKNHSVVVTHNFNRELITTTFPNAKILQIYPYTKIGNTLYNISYKKLSRTIPNLIDNHLIQIKEWYNHIVKSKPAYQCTNFADLSNQLLVEELLGSKLSIEQQLYFCRYWNNQLMYDLSIPTTKLPIDKIIDFWKIRNWCNEWSIAYLIFVYELTHDLSEDRRKWSIDQKVFENWNDVISIEHQYS